MTKREAVVSALWHRDTRPVPYNFDMTEALRERIIEATGDPLFEEHTGSYLAQANNAKFEDLGGGKFRDQFGVVWDKGTQEGDFGVVSRYILTEPSFGDYRVPKPDEADIRRKCEALSKQNDRYTMYTIGFSLFERAWTLRSMPEVLCDMIAEKEFLGELLDRIVDYNLAVIDIAAEYPIDCIFFGDDWGQQQGLIMGLPLWREFIKPRLKREYDHVKRKGMFVAQHSCGDCREVFPDLKELGLDIYNTFQPEIYDIELFKRLYGDTITFFGGISTQTLLPVATPERVRSETRRILSILSRDGGYILAPTHAMTPDTPIENALAFLEVCRNQDG